MQDQAQFANWLIFSNLRGVWGEGGVQARNPACTEQLRITLNTRHEWGLTPRQELYQILPDFGLSGDLNGL